MITPVSAVKYYQQVVEYLGGKLGMPAKMVHRTTYDEIDVMLENKELNIIERCIALASEKIIRPGDLPPHISGTSPRKTSLLTLQDVTVEAEKNHITQILKLTGGNRSRAAEILGISRKTLWEKVTGHQLDL